VPAPTKAAAEEQEIVPPEDEAWQQRRERRITRLMEKYAQACEEGRTDDAMKFAIKALLIDPTFIMQMLKEMSSGYSDSHPDLRMNQRYPIDPTIPINQLLNNSEDLRSIESEKSRTFFLDQPSHLPPPPRGPGGAK